MKKGEFAWDIILALGRGADGKHKQKWVRFHGTKKQAEQKLNDLVGEVQHGEFVEPSRLTVGQWLDEWLKVAIRPPLCAQNTYRTYCGIVEKHIKPGLGHVLLQQLTPLHVERYYAECRTKLAERSVVMHHAILTTALKAAVNASVLRSDTKRARRPRVRVAKDLLNVWTSDEARRLLSTAKQEGNAQYTALFALALDSGVRKGELLGLRWTDLEGTKLKVERQLLGMKEDEATSSWSLDTSLPKGGKARSLDLSEETVVLLREHKRQQAEVKLRNRLQYADFGLMFAQQWEQHSSKHAVLGWPLCRTTVATQLDRLCVVAKVKRITVHGLRHTCATLMMQAGVLVNVVSERLGHADPAMTLRVYAHVLPGMQQDAASRLAAVYYG
jgi:integrase